MLLWALAEGVPPEIAGIPTWALNGLSIGGLVAMIVFSLMTDRLWTKGQVNRLIEQHRENTKLLTERYELHITRTVELWKARADDAIRRETDWAMVAKEWQKVATVLGDAIDPLNVASETTLEIVRQMQAWQLANPPRSTGRRAT